MSLLRDIPKNDRRYDATLDSVGKNKDGQFVARYIIDNGKYKGKRVTQIIGNRRQYEMLKLLVKEFRRSFCLTHESVIKKDGKSKVIKGDLPKYRELIKQADYIETYYMLSEFDEPKGESELTEVFDRQKRSKFIRG